VPHETSPYEHFLLFSYGLLRKLIPFSQAHPFYGALVSPTFARIPVPVNEFFDCRYAAGSLLAAKLQSNSVTWQTMRL